MVDRHVYSLTRAAEATGMTRQGVLAAIRRGTISAQKNALGQWAIDPAELHRVYPPVHAVRAADVVTPSVTTHVDSNVNSPVTPPAEHVSNTASTINTAYRTALDELAELRKELAVGRALLEAARDKAETALREVDAWKEQSHQWMVMSQKALPEGDVKSKKRSLLARLFLARD